MGGRPVPQRLPLHTTVGSKPGYSDFIAQEMNEHG
jgi:hypothetical protein